MSQKQISQSCYFVIVASLKHLIFLTQAQSLFCFKYNSTADVSSINYHYKTSRLIQVIVLHYLLHFVGGPNPFTQLLMLISPVLFLTCWSTVDRQLTRTTSTRVVLQLLQHLEQLDHDLNGEI